MEKAADAAGRKKCFPQKKAGKKSWNLYEDSSFFACSGGFSLSRWKGMVLPGPA